MVHRSFRARWMTAVSAAAAAAMLLLSAPAFAAGVSEEDVPSTSIVPAEGPSGSAPAGSPASAASPSTTAPKTWMPGLIGAKPKSTSGHASSKSSVSPPAVEPADAHLKVLTAAPVYTAPSKSSKHIEQLSPDKFVVVTGSTHYFLQVKLKSGETGYIDPASVELVKPTDKVFVLTHDAAVLDKPNRWGKKLAEVHQTHNVHVVGIALNYLRIRMKSGLEGFIPETALE